MDAARRDDDSVAGVQALTAALELGGATRLDGGSGGGSWLWELEPQPDEASEASAAAEAETALTLIARALMALQGELQTAAAAEARAAAADLCVTNTPDEPQTDGIVALIRRSARMRHFLRPGAGPAAGAAAAQNTVTPIYMGRLRHVDQVTCCEFANADTERCSGPKSTLPPGGSCQRARKRPAGMPGSAWRFTGCRSRGSPTYHGGGRWAKTHTHRRPRGCWTGRMGVSTRGSSRARSATGEGACDSTRTRRRRRRTKWCRAARWTALS